VSAVRFEVEHTDANCQARIGSLSTPHGLVRTPAFMPVGTQGTVKGVTVEQLRTSGAEMILGNTYHLALRPGEKVVADLGGLHSFMGWDGPILTDSGGFQVFSLAHRMTISEEGVHFRSHIDGAPMHLTPERAIAIQESLGSDVAMVLDHVVTLPSPRDMVAEAMQRSVRWARRCLAAANRPDQALFAIVQGGLDPDLRRDSAAELVALEFSGYAIGGLSVGESAEEMYATLDTTVPHLPSDRPRYLMGVGRPQDVLQAIERGVDLFDCVLPTRNGRNAMAFTDRGPLRLRNLRHASDAAPLEPGCPCPACRHSRGYLRHLFQADEMLGPVLLSLHNLTYYQRLVAGARSAIASDSFGEYKQERLQDWAAGESNNSSCGQE
jgi:queuine tRNA-ribosyltransferase